MADLVEVAVESALINRLKAFALSPAIPLALPNVEFNNKPAAEPGNFWLRASFLPANSLALGVAFSSTNQHYGIFQVDVFFSQGSGELAPGRIAAQLISWFARGTMMSKDGFDVLVNLKPYRSRMVRDGDGPWAMIPVSVPYIAFAT